METHPSGSEFELYVIGALPAPQAAVLEAHVLSCAACSERLEREARLELALSEVARSVAAAPAPSITDLGEHRAQGARSRGRQRDGLGRARRALGGTPGRLGAATLLMAAAAALLIVPRLGHGPERQDAPAGAGPQVALEPRGAAEAPGLAVSPVALQAERTPSPDPWRVACPSHLSLSECRSEARRRGLSAISSAEAEDFPHFELTGRAAVARFSTAGWQR